MGRLRSSRGSVDWRGDGAVVPGGRGAVAFSYEKGGIGLSTGCRVRRAERCRAIQQELSSPADGRALVSAAVADFGRLMRWW